MRSLQRRYTIRTLFSRIRPYFAKEAREGLGNLTGSELLAAISPQIYWDLLNIHGSKLDQYTQKHSLDYITIDFIQINTALFETTRFFVIKQKVILFTDGAKGHSVSPAIFTVLQTNETTDPAAADFEIEYGLGVKDDAGRLLYPCRGRYYGEDHAHPSRAEDWAIYQKLVLSKSRKLGDLVKRWKLSAMTTLLWPWA